MLTVVDKQLIIVIEPPKTGSTSIRRAFQDAGHHVMDPPNRHWTAAELRAWIGCENWGPAKRLCLLRNPFDRVRSQLAVLRTCSTPHRKNVERDFFAQGEAGRKYWPLRQFVDTDIQHFIRIERAEEDLARAGLDLSVPHLNRGEPLDDIPLWALDRAVADASWFYPDAPSLHAGVAP